MRSYLSRRQSKRGDGSDGRVARLCVLRVSEWTGEGFQRGGSKRRRMSRTSDSEAGPVFCTSDCWWERLKEWPGERNGRERRREASDGGWKDRRSRAETTTESRTAEADHNRAGRSVGLLGTGQRRKGAIGASERAPTGAATAAAEGRGWEKAAARRLVARRRSYVYLIPAR